MEAETTDPFNLQRFVAAQDPAYGDACSELRSGLKESHWMWFIFPQIKGLGYSFLSQKFAISSRQEAEAYLRHPILGPRLRECTRLVNLLEGRSVQDIFGYPDDMKFKSCMTLFASATPDNQIFLDALGKYYAGEMDTLTLQLLSA
ncbi:MAG: DUF1810 domain-containing protein [Candidatus Korobacteraceae bacterium]